MSNKLKSYHTNEISTKSYSNKSYLMISYSWANEEDVNLIIEKLSPYLKIWRDINSLPGSSDLWNTIALAVQEAEFFIPIISPEYEKSDSCTNELNFALNNKQIVVPIFLNPDFRPTGNVGLRISKLYYMAFKQVVDCPFTFIKHLNSMGANYLKIGEDEKYQIKSLKVPIESLYNHAAALRNNKENIQNKQIMSKKSTKNTSLDGFNIHQKNADHAQFDIYSSDKDDSFSYQCSGKFVSIVDFDYISTNELNKSQINDPSLNENSSVAQLIFEDVKCFFNCFVLMNEESLLLASENGQIYHLVLNNKEQNYYTCNFDVKFNQGDLELYKMGLKTLIDMCVDSAGNLIILNRNKLNNDIIRPLYNYSIESFRLKSDRSSTSLTYKKTLFILDNQGLSQNKTIINQNNINFQCLFTRIYSFENDTEQSVILIDNANKRILWYKKNNGLKIRCIKTLENNLEDLKSFIPIDEDNQIFLCSKAGLFCLKRQNKIHKNCKIKHFDSLKSCIDVCYDDNENNIIFINSNSIFRGRFFDKIEDKKSTVDENNNFEMVSYKEPLLKYKQLFSHKQANKDFFKRVILSKNLIFILSNGDEPRQKNSVFIIDKNKLEKFKS